MEMYQFAIPKVEHTYVLEIEEETPQPQEYLPNAGWNRAYIRNDTDYTIFLSRQGKYQEKTIARVENGDYLLIALPQPLRPQDPLKVYWEGPGGEEYLPNSPAFLRIDFGISTRNIEDEKRWSTLVRRYNEGDPVFSTPSISDDTIQGFAFLADNNDGIESNVEASVSNLTRTITAEVPAAADKEELVASFLISNDHELLYDGSPVEDGVTEIDYTSEVTLILKNTKTEDEFEYKVNVSEE